jgi:ABC-2 type transport system permease protein
MSPPPARATAWFSLNRVGAMMLRHLYLFRGSWPRIIELAYWPIVQVILWGFITRFFLTHSSWLVQASGALIAGVLLWDVMFRGQLGISLAFLEELWSRNLGQLFVTPLHPVEWVVSMMAMSFLRTVAGLLPGSIVAILLYEYSIYDMGLAFVAFFAQLIVFSWAIGFAVAALLLRFGLGAESLAWVSIFALAPLSAIYYPVASLPEIVQPIAWALPSAYVFEGMRAVLIDGVFRLDLFWWAAGLNALYIGLGAGLFLYTFRIARVRGFLLQQGE